MASVRCVLRRVRWKPPVARGLLDALVLSAVLGATSAQAQTPIQQTELGVSLGSFATVQGYEGGGTTELFGLASVQGRARFFGWLTVDGWFAAGPAFTPNLSLGSCSLAVRAGVGLEHFGAVLGPVLNIAPGAASVVQTLPSLTLWAGAGHWRGVLGVFDRPELAIARLGVEYDDYGLAFVGPLYGAEAYGRWWINDRFAIDARLLFTTLLKYDLASATVGLTWAQGGRR